MIGQVIIYECIKYTNCKHDVIVHVKCSGIISIIEKKFKHVSVNLDMQFDELCGERFFFPFSKFMTNYLHKLNINFCEKFLR